MRLLRMGKRMWYDYRQLRKEEIRAAKQGTYDVSEWRKK